MRNRKSKMTTAGPHDATLAGWLERQVRYVEIAAPKVEPHDDLATLLIALLPDGRVEVQQPRFDGPAQKAAIMNAFADRLKRLAAVRYAIIAAAWMLKAGKDESDEMVRAIEEHGTSDGTRYEARRVECYQCVAGDSRETLMQTLTVARDAAGRIVKLDRLPVMASHEPGGSYSRGRMVDLLVSRH